MTKESLFKNRVEVSSVLNAPESLQDIWIAGWIRTKRESKKFVFLELNDGSCLLNLQIIADNDIAGADLLPSVSTGTSVAVKGNVVASKGHGQKWELHARSIKVFGTNHGEYPLQKKRHSDEFLRQNAHLRARTNKYGALARLRSYLSGSINRFFEKEGFNLVHTPIITGSDCEGAGEMFRVTTLPIDAGNTSPKEDFFGKEAHLTVSGQLAVETYCLALSKVYTFGPTFRSENSNTSRHMAEFWMIEPEMAYADVHDNMDVSERFVKSVLTDVIENCDHDMQLFFNYVDKDLKARLLNLIENPFERLSYDAAIQILSSAEQQFEFPIEWGHDLQAEHERYLTETYFKKAVFVYDWPIEIKAFYMRRNDDSKTVAAMDLLVPQIGELIGGSAREERLEVLTEAIKSNGDTLDDYWWYLDTRKFGSVPHAGFGLGFERFLMLITGVTNIRDVIPFPRTPKNLEF
jgi:asparaginyl-tRNA synthetase